VSADRVRTSLQRFFFPRHGETIFVEKRRRAAGKTDKKRAGHSDHHALTTVRDQSFPAYGPAVGGARETPGSYHILAAAAAAAAAVGGPVKPILITFVSNMRTSARVCEVCLSECHGPRE